MKKKVVSILILLFVGTYTFSQQVMNSLNQNTIEIKKVDWIVILAIGSDIDSKVLQDRLNNAILAHQLWPDSKILLVGSEFQSKHEVSIMKKYLIEHEVPQSLITTDGECTNTWNSLEHAQKIMSPNETALIVTNEFHQKRAISIANILGIRAAFFGKDSQKFDDSLNHTIMESLSSVKWLANYAYYKLSL